MMSTRMLCSTLALCVALASVCGCAVRSPPVTSVTGGFDDQLFLDRVLNQASLKEPSESRWNDVIWYCKYNSEYSAGSLWTARRFQSTLVVIEYRIEITRDDRPVLEQVRRTDYQQLSYKLFDQMALIFAQSPRWESGAFFAVDGNMAFAGVGSSKRTLAAALTKSDIEQVADWLTGRVPFVDRRGEPVLPFEMTVPALIANYY